MPNDTEDNVRLTLEELVFLMPIHLDIDPHDWLTLLVRWYRIQRYLHDNLGLAEASLRVMMPAGPLLGPCRPCRTE